MEKDLHYELLQQVLAGMQAAVLVEDADRHIAHVNPKFCEMFGLGAAPEALLGADCSKAAEQTRHLFRDGAGFVGRVEELLQERQAAQGDLLEMADGRFLERDYLPLFVGDRYQGHMWIYRDVTNQEIHRRHMRDMALRDDLTRLYNRRGFMQLVEQRLARIRFRSEPALLAVLDMDNLKDINDSLGHTEGDRALIDFAEVLRNTLRSSDIIARLGGDEFAALVVGTGAPASVRARLRQGLDEFNATRERPYQLSASVGFSRCEEGCLADLLRRADERMYMAKRSRKETSAVRCISLPAGFVPVALGRDRR